VKRTTTVALALIVVFWAAILAVIGPRLSALWRLSAASEVTEGVVTHRDSRDHNRATYEYEAHGQRHTNSEVASIHRKGDRVMVYYLPKDPSVSALVAPWPAFREGLAGSAILCVLAVVTAVWLARRLNSGT
jgi:hypothetical protein